MELLDYLPLAAAVVLVAVGVGWLGRRSKASGGPGVTTEGQREAFIDTVPGISAGTVETAAGGASDGPVTVATYSLPERAHLGRLLLEGHGIPAFVADENLVATDWLYANAIGGVKLQVQRRHAAEAVRLLTEARDRMEEQASAHDAPPEPPAAVVGGAEVVAPRCPSCGSDEVYTGHTGRKLAYATLLVLNFPVSWLGRSYECDRCGHRWSPAPSAAPRPRGG